LLVPATVVLLGQWNWWPSKLRMDRAEEDSALAGVGGPAGTVGPAAAGAAGGELR
jgi:uncharacterized membrane protein YdfJ with MMPL/SSD domain